MLLFIHEMVNVFDLVQCLLNQKKNKKKKQIVTRRKLCRTSKRNVHYPDAIVYGFGVDNSQSVDKESKKKQTKIDKYLEFR